MTESHATVPQAVSNMNAALFAVKQGWKVVPAKVWKDSDGKKAVDFYVKWGTGSTNDYEVVRDWWVQWPDAVVGILTKANDLLVIDLDCHGDGQDGEAEWHRIVGERAGGELPTTFTVRTPTGGLHIYFTNTDARLKNSASKLAPGVDVRGAGGQAGGIVFFGSRFDGEYVVEDDSPVAPLPEWLADYLLSTVSTKTRGRDTWATPNPDRKFTVEQAQAFTYTYGLQKLEQAEAGERNNALNSAAICLGHFGPDFWEPEKAINKLRFIARNIGLDPQEIEATIQSGYYDAEWFATLVTKEEAEDAELKARLKEERLRRLVRKTVDAEEMAARISIEDMLVRRGALDSVPDVEPLIDGFLYRRSVALLYGRRNVSKTFVAIDMALCVATKTDWAQHPDVFHDVEHMDEVGYPVRKGKVLWIAGEGVHGIRSRVLAWEKRNKKYAEDFILVDGAIELASEARVEQLAAVVKREGIDLIVVDTLARNTAGLEENSASDMKVFFDRIDALKNAHDGACVLIVHHQGKGESTESRGSTVIEDAPESVFWLSGDPASAVTLKTTKQRDTRKARSLVFHLEDVEGTTSAVNVRGASASAEDGAPVVEEERTYDIFMSLYSETGCTSAELRNSIMEKTGCQKSVASERINEMLKFTDAVKKTEMGKGRPFRLEVG